MKRIILAGLLGGAVFLVWFIIIDGILGFKRGIEMKQLINERWVYTFLSEHVTEPGRYVCNPEVLPEQGFPGEDPIFVVQYSGLGHADAGQEMLVGLIVMFLAPFLGAWVLANASSRILSGYCSRLLFFSGIGAVMSLFGIMARFSIGGYPLGDTLALTLHDLVAWVVAGIVIARLVKPVPQGG
jgi:hypothetical protein